MVQTPDNQIIADVLRAYALQKDFDALPVVLSFVNSDHATVRSAAREATLAYGQDAVWKLREAYAVLTGESAPEGAAASDLAKKLFDAYDRYRLDDVYALLDEGLAKQKAHDLKGAIAAFDEALARQPLLDRRAEMTLAYAEYGESLEGSDRPAALMYLRKALRLDESGDRTRHAQSELLYLEGEDLLARGLADTEPFEQALVLDASNARARAELDKLRAQTVSGRSRAYRLAGAGALLVLAIAGIAVFGGKRRPSGRN
jgi:tetratricopeptide (TPR) repeat protein